MPLRLSLAFRNVFRNQTRSLITLSVIAFGCIAIICAYGFVEAAIQGTVEWYVRSFLGHVQIAKKGYFERGVAEPFNYLISNPSKCIEVISSTPHVEFVTPRVEFGGILSTGENSIAFLGQGVIPEQERKINAHIEIVAGKDITSEDRFKIIVGTGLAQGVLTQVDAPLIMLTNTRTGLIDAMDASVKGIFQSPIKNLDDRAIRIPLKDAQKILHLDDDIHNLVVLLDKTAMTDEVQATLVEKLSQAGFDLDVRSWHQLPGSDFIHKADDFMRRLLFVFQLIVLCVVIFSIFNTMNMSVLERTGEIGTLMALGDTRMDIMKLFLTEGFVLGALGGILGIAGSLIVAKVVTYIGIPMPPPPASTKAWVVEIWFIPTIVVFTYILALMSSVLSSLYPAYKASKLSIAEALRHNI